MSKYDLVIIGSGPGGYVAAIRAAQLGLKTAIIEKYNTLGGTCLNVGCIPSKALLDSSEHYHNADTTFKEHGIKLSNLAVDMKQMIKRKNDVVDQTCKGVEFLMKKNKIDVFTGVGSFKSAKVVTVTSSDGKSQDLEAKNVIIATGSKPVTPKAFNYDKNRVITSTEALNIDKLPKKMVIIGAGVIGLELGSVFARLGTEVDVVEYMDSIIAEMDVDCGKELRRALKKLGINFHLKHEVVSVKGNKTAVTVGVKKRDSEEQFDIKADYCLIAIGRRPYTDGLGLENIKAEVDDRGRVRVNDHLETAEPGVYAIGDVIPGAMLAHKAEEEGVYVAELLAGQKPHIDYNLIPGVVYTWPEVAAVGKTEQQLKEEGKAYKSGKFPFKALGRARASMDTDGMIKVLADKETDEILGVHMVGPRVADVIMEAVALMEFRASAEDMARICHPHPTYTEAAKEAALAATGDRALHI
ncbi:dihydrolipoyl dehydrogenase [Portibacter marinus]|uniref:dihydrolipoyl dehydrogenase n=1 Tax=Portibacter marinus TaxID=2898660 RepID=UPI001F1ADFAC|nr:dihydrolipoyl dehydrogenase [Portibacter marinus]